LGELRRANSVGKLMPFYDLDIILARLARAVIASNPATARPTRLR
jgi:hypothetical protein